MLIDKWDWSIEDVVKSTQAHMIKSFLEIGKNIVVDSTNLKNNSLIYQAAIDSGCDFDVEYKEKIESIVSQRNENLNPMQALSYSSHPLKLLYAKGQFLY